ncbi:MAG: di-heme oxidoredictase family protein, partial [Myxococcota bacterium]
PRATILAAEDPSDTNADGISGRAHVLGDGRVGRLGWKASVPNLAEFARDGMSNELGMTLADQTGLTFGAGSDNDAAPDPEVSAAELADLVFYMANLAPPPRNRVNEALEDAGEQVFANIGCAACHTPSMNTEAGAPVNLYSDLLLHDVSPPNFRGIVDGDAGMREFRTAPLWGLSVTAPYMHDGHSDTIEEAILRHDAEAGASRQAFSELSQQDHQALMAFLRSL